MEFVALITIGVVSINFMLTDYKLNKLEEKIDKLLEEKKGE